MVFQFGHVALLAGRPGETVVVGDKEHVIRVDGSERGQAVADDGEECDKDIINHIHDIELLAANVYPACVS